MAIGIDRGSVFDIWDIPLIGGGDNAWSDNSWIVEHLRGLADKIEKESPNIYHIGIGTDKGYRVPMLSLKVFAKEVVSIY